MRSRYSRTCCEIARETAADPSILLGCGDASWTASSMRQMLVFQEVGRCAGFSKPAVDCPRVSVVETANSTASTNRWTNGHPQFCLARRAFPCFWTCTGVNASCSGNPARPIRGQVPVRPDPGAVRNCQVGSGVKGRAHHLRIESGEFHQRGLVFDFSVTLLLDLCVVLQRDTVALRYHVTALQQLRPRLVWATSPDTRGYGKCRRASANQGPRQLAQLAEANCVEEGNR